jgi:hypothetical protein
MPEVTVPAPAQHQTPQPAQGETPPEPIKFDEWINAQPAEVVAAYQEHTTGLQNTVKATRKERDDLSKQIATLTAQAAKGSELEKSLQDLQGQLEATNRRASFAEDAGRPEIGCSNPKAAFAIAQAENLFTRTGAPDWNAIKAAAPELFIKKPTTPAGDGGNGSRTGSTAAMTMDERIRSMVR